MEIKLPQVKENLLHNNTRISILFLMVLFSTTVSYAQRNIYVDLDSNGNSYGTEKDPYKSIGDAVYEANADPANFIENAFVIDGASQVDVNIYVKGTTQGPVYLTFGERKDSTFIHILPWPGEGNFIVDNQNSTEGTNVGLSITLNKFADFKLSGLTLTGGYYENYGVLIDVLNHNQPTVKIEDCTFDTISWTTDNSEALYPPDFNSYLFPLYFNAKADQNIELNNNVFNQVAVGHGKLVGSTSSNTAITNFNAGSLTGTDDNGNRFFSILYPWTAAAATEFYIDNSVPAGTSGFGGSGSKNDPWKYLTSANFGAVFNDFSTDPPIAIDKDVTIYFEEGTHMLQNSIYMSGINTSSSLILKPAPGAEGKVTLDGSGITGQWESIIACNNCNNVTIEGLKLTNLTNNKAYDLDTRFGIIFNGSGSNINILNNEIFNMHWSNNATDKLNPIGSNNLGGIQVLGTLSEPITQVAINGNNVHDITPGYTEAITVNGNVDGFEIKNNTVTDIANIGIVAAGNYAWVLIQVGATVTKSNNFSKNGVISGNTVTRCVSPIAVSGGLYVDGATNVLVTDNISTQNGAGISVGHEQDEGTSGGHTITNNVLYDNIDAGMYIGSTNAKSMVEDVTVSGNISRNNYNDDSTLLALANGKYGGGEKHAEIKIYRITDLTFTGNEVTSDSDVVMVKSSFELHEGNHSYSNNTYSTLSNNPTTAQFIYATEGAWNPKSFCEHQAEGYDLDSTLGTETTCTTLSSEIPDISVVEGHVDTDARIYTLVSDSEIFLDGNLSITGLPAEYDGVDLLIAADKTFEVSTNDEGYYYFLAPTYFNTSGFPSSHFANNNSSVTLIGDAGTLKNYDFSKGNDPAPTNTPLSAYKITNNSGVTHIADLHRYTFPVARSLRLEVHPQIQVDYNAFADAQGLVKHTYHSSNAKGYNHQLDGDDAVYNPTNIAIKLEIQIVAGEQLTVAIEEANSASLLSAMKSNNPDLDIGYSQHLSIDPSTQTLISEKNFMKADLPEISGTKNYVEVDVKNTAATKVAVFTENMLNTNFIILDDGIILATEDITDCTACNLKVANPTLIGDYSSTKSLTVNKYTSTPVKNDATHANCLTSYPNITYTSTSTSQVIFDAGSSATEYYNWKNLAKPSNFCSPVLSSIPQTFASNVGSKFIVGTTGTMNPDLGWLPLLEDDLTQTTVGNKKIYFVDISQEYQVVQFIPANTTVWGTGTNIKTFQQTKFTVKNTSKKVVQNPTEIKELEVGLENQILLYPNPVKNTLNVQFTNNEPAQVVIYNIKGAVIKDFKHTPDTHENKVLSVNVSKYSEGVYLLKTTQENNTSVKRFVVKK